MLLAANSSMLAQLNAIKAEIISGPLQNVIAVSITLAGTGGILFISYRVWKSLAKAEPVDIWGLLRPFVLCLLILNFTLITGFIDGAISSIDHAISGGVQTQKAKVENRQDVQDAIRKVLSRKQSLTQEELDKLGMSQEAFDVSAERLLSNSEEGRKVLSNLRSATGASQGVESGQEERKIKFSYTDIFGSIEAWAQITIQKFLAFLLGLIAKVARFFIGIISTFVIIVLTILGPLAFALGCYDGFSNAITNWITKYIGISLWMPVAKVLELVVDATTSSVRLSASQALMNSDMPGGSWIPILMSLVAVIAYFTVPSIANMVVEGAAGVAGALGSHATRMAGKPASALSSFAGGAIGGATGKLAAKAMKGFTSRK